MINQLQFGPDGVLRDKVEIAIKRADAIAFAKRWKARAWLVKDGKPETMIWPEQP